jgi:hypothetical protein
MIVMTSPMPKVRTLALWTTQTLSKALPQTTMTAAADKGGTTAG